MRKINSQFSFIILTFNEEIHLCRLLDSISGLKANTYVLDSGSMDGTLSICDQRNIAHKYSAFTNHPNQWAAALRLFEITTPWTIGLDADQTLSPQLYDLLYNFRDSDHKDIDGIYFNRKNYFKKKWIKHGGYFPMYLLKMFRTGIGYSDLSERMDHRFQVTGKTIIWKTGYLREENLKESNISFWIAKHNRYSDLLAQEEYEGYANAARVSCYHGFSGSPNDKKVWKKQLWQRLPLYYRSLAYLLVRLFLQRGLFDGRTGILFHFLQSFWFRIIVDMKIEELRKTASQHKSISYHASIIFIIRFLLLFTSLYYFNILFIGISTPGGVYLEVVDEHLNYINFIRNVYIVSSAQLLHLFGFNVTTNLMGLTVANHAGFNLVYSCLGYGIASCFTAFSLTFPQPVRFRYAFLFIGVAGIFTLNICRLILVSIYYRPEFSFIGLDHHEMFNMILYAAIILYSYLWLNLSHHVK